MILKLKISPLRCFIDSFFMQQFLRENNLKLILRSHEGPDAREDREDMANMLDGWTEDHVTPAGRLMTVFSAPDYPQFMAQDAKRYCNKAAVAVLTAPDYDSPNMKQYEAVLPRPEATPYYDLFVNDSDEELEVVPSTVSGMTDVKQERVQEAEGEVKSAPKEEENGEEEVVSQKLAIGSPKKAPGSPTAGGTSSTPKAHSRGSSPTRWHPQAT